MNRMFDQKKTGTSLVAFLTALVSLSVFSTDIYLPSLPEMVKVFDTSLSHVQCTLSSYMAGFALSMLLSGVISDRFGRKRVVLTGMAIHFVTSLMCLVASRIEILILARFFQALGGCCGTILGRVIIRDLYPHNQCVKILSYMATGMSLSPALAPILGGYLQAWYGWKGSFALLACISGSIFLLTFFFFKESLTVLNREALYPRRLIANYGKVLRDRDFLGYTGTITFAWCGYFGFICSSSFIFINLLKVSPVVYGLLYGVVVIGYFIGTLLSGKLADRYEIRKAVLIGTLVALTGSIILVVNTLLVSCSVMSMMVPMSVFLIGVGILMPNCQVAATDPFPTLIGTAASLFYFIEMMGGAAAGALVRQSNEISEIPMVVLNVSASLLMCLSFWSLIWLKKPGSATQQKTIL